MSDKSSTLRKAYANVSPEIPSPLGAVTELLDDDAKRAFLRVAARVRRSSRALVARFKAPSARPE